MTDSESAAITRLTVAIEALSERFRTVEEQSKAIEARLAHVVDRMCSLETSVDGVYSYVQRAVEGDRRDLEHAELENGQLRKQLGDLELARAGDLERNERKARGAE